MGSKQLDDEEKVSVDELSKAEEAKGKLEFDNVNDKLMHSVVKNDKKTIDKGNLLQQSLNNGISAFNSDMMHEHIVKNFSTAKNIYGDKLLRFVSGYETDYIGKNLKVPEFQKILKKNVQDKVEELKKGGLLNRDGEITDRGIELASLVLYREELEHLEAKGFQGEKVHKKNSAEGDPHDFRNFKKGDKYKDISITKSVKNSIRRGHKSLEMCDLKVTERESKGHIEVVYAIDASGSMKGEKIGVAKKAGVALAYKAIERKDKVGLIVFGSDIKEEIRPTDDFLRLLKNIAVIKASKQTDFIKTIKKAVELFSGKDVTKHLILLTDAMPTVGKEDPQKETLKAVSIAKSDGITVSVAGIHLDKKGKQFAENVVRMGEGKLYNVRDLEELDQIILEDYYSFI